MIFISVYFFQIYSWKCTNILQNIFIFDITYQIQIIELPFILATLFCHTYTYRMNIYIIAYAEYREHNYWLLLSIDQKISHWSNHCKYTKWLFLSNRWEAEASVLMVLQRIEYNNNQYMKQFKDAALYYYPCNIVTKNIYHQQKNSYYSL